MYQHTVKLCLLKLLIWMGHPGWQCYHSTDKSKIRNDWYDNKYHIVCIIWLWWRKVSSIALRKPLFIEKAWKGLFLYPEKSNIDKQQKWWDEKGQTRNKTITACSQRKVSKNFRQNGFSSQGLKWNSWDLIKVTRHNNGIYRKMVEQFKAENSTQVDLLRWGFWNNKSECFYAETISIKEHC